METQWNSTYLDFPMLGRRAIVADFDGGDISSDGGALLLRTTEQLTAIIHQCAACFTDHRRPDLVEHPVTDLIAQRRSAPPRGYGDLTGPADLRCAPPPAPVPGTADPTGKPRRRQRDRGKPL